MWSIKTTYKLIIEIVESTILNALCSTINLK